MPLSFGQEVRRLREVAGVSQAALAEALGVHQTFISKVEKGENVLGADLLFSLCDALGMPCDHFRPFLSKINGGAATIAAAGLPKKRQPGRPKKADAPPQAPAPPAKGKK